MELQGCGSTYLKAFSKYMKSVGRIGGCSYNASSGVKQGASSSCNAFTFYIDKTIAAVNSVGEDDWLNDIHTLLFIWRAKMETKLRKLKDATDELEMAIHPTKSKYILLWMRPKYNLSTLIMSPSTIRTNIYTWEHPSPTTQQPTNIATATSGTAASAQIFIIPHQEQRVPFHHHTEYTTAEKHGWRKPWVL